MKYPLLFLLLWTTSKQYAQSALSCSSDKLNSEFQIQNAPYASQEANYERAYRKSIPQQLHQKKLLKNTFVFPVVIHIIHDCAALGTKQNPTDSTVNAVITKTNHRFRHSYPNAPVFEQSFYGIDTEMEFCLAKKDPDGNYTSGIVRYSNASYSSGETNTQALYFSDTYLWDTKQYLNIFIVTDTEVAGVYIGGSNRDFIIIHSDFLWDGLLTHELGHYFSLKHIFFSDTVDDCLNTDCLTEGDYVCDTPPKGLAGKNGGTCAQPNNSCNTDHRDLNTYNPFRPIELGGLGDQPDMLSNYMDYTSDCWSAFTQGQKERMHFNIEERRLPMVSAATAICNFPSPKYEIAIVDADFLAAEAAAKWLPSIKVKNNGQATVTNLHVNISIGEDRKSTAYPTEISPGKIQTIQLESLPIINGNTTVFVSIVDLDADEDAFSNNNEYCLTANFSANLSNSACQPVIFTKEVSLCENKSVEGHTGPGTFRDTFAIANGCDSIRILNINVSSERTVTQIDASICAGETLNGRTEKGAYIDVFAGANGCDSVRILNLTILPVIDNTIPITICEGEQYEGYSSIGTYVDTLQSITGCDSIRVLKLSVENTATCLTTSTYDQDLADSFLLYPNPTYRQIWIESTRLLVENYKIHNSSGQLIVHQNSVSKRQSIDTNNWTAGIYFLHIETSKSSIVKKIIKL